MCRVDKTALRAVRKGASNRKQYRIVATNLTLSGLRTIVNLGRPAEFTAQGTASSFSFGFFFKYFEAASFLRKMPLFTLTHRP